MTATRISDRAAALPSFDVMDVVAAARTPPAGAPLPVCHLEVGQPGDDPPRAVLDAAAASLVGPAGGGSMGYTDALGTAALREALAGFHARRYGTTLDPQRFALTTGASAGCLLAFLACFDIGDRVAVIEPGYPCYANILSAVGVEVVVVEVGPDTGFVPTPAHLERAGPLQGVVVASPSNPTGTTLTAEELAALVEWSGTHGATLVVDEIYHGTTDLPVPSAAGPDHVVVVQSFSKYFCMTGWRLGWAVLPPALVRPVERLAQNLYLAPPTIAQVAALAALACTDELDERARRYRTNRGLLVDALAQGGLTNVAPATGAFYVWADTTGFGDSPRLCARWLREIGVAATPGTDFDARTGDSHVRFSVAGDTEEVALAGRRLRDWLLAESP